MSEQSNNGTRAGGGGGVVWSLISLVLLSSGSCDSAGPTSTVDDTLIPDPASDAEVIARHLSIDLGAPLAYSSHEYPVHYRPVIPNDNAPADNPVTDRGATLGRVLFHDDRLSLNRTVSCASCHVQELGFTDGDRFSEGFEGGRTGAHSMRLANANFYRGDDMFWDRRAGSLEDQVLEPILDPVEMGFTEGAGGVGALLTRIREQEYYPILFEEAFGTDDVTEARIRSALAQYVRSIVSTESRYDAAVASFGSPIQPGQIGALPGFTDEENLGLRLFALPPGQGGAGCSGCHELPSLALDPNSRSNGLDARESTVFKSPSLKNVAVSGPYMHDGRFDTLLEVVEHYNSGVQPGPALDRRLTAGGPGGPGGPGGGGGAPIRLNLTDAEKLALVAFMETLTDTSLLTDPRFADPFINR